MRRSTAIVLSLAFSVAIVCLSTASAGATLVFHQAGRIDVMIPNHKVCGITSTFHAVEATPIVVKEIDGYLLILSTGHATLTATVPDGRWVSFSTSGPQKDVSVTPVSGNTIVVRTMTAGPLALVASNGDSVRDVGRLVTDNTIDDNGTPLDPYDDTLLNVQVVRVSGANYPAIDICAFDVAHLA
jgi:hypothetical protein